MANLINATESVRLDYLTAYNSTILNALSGETLDAALSRKRRGAADADYRIAVLNNTHPDDLAQELIGAGHTLHSIGVESIQVST